MRRELARPRRMGLPTRLKRTGLQAQLHQIVHKARRNPEVARRLPVPMTLVNIRSTTTTQLNR